MLGVYCLNPRASLGGVGTLAQPQGCHAFLAPTSGGELFWSANLSYPPGWLGFASFPLQSVAFFHLNRPPGFLPCGGPCTLANSAGNS